MKHKVTTKFGVLFVIVSLAVVTTAAIVISRANAANISWEAFNAAGAIHSMRFGELMPIIAQTPTPAGITCLTSGILNDAAGDTLDSQASHDVQQLSIAEPAIVGSGKVMFILKMADVSIFPRSEEPTSEL